MRNLKKLLAVIVSVCVLATFALPAFAAETDALTDAEVCETLGVVKGDSSLGVTDDYLAKGTSRLQAAILYLRMLGLEDEALAYEGEENFDDAADVAWAGGKAILGYLKANPDLGWEGIGGNKFDPNSVTSAQMMYKVALEALGYKQGVDFEWADVFTFAADKGLGKAADLTELTNNDMCTIVVEMLGGIVKDGDMTLLDKLIADGLVDKDDAIAAGLIPAVPEELEVVDVTADTLKQLVVEFNQEIKEAGDDGNYSIETDGNALIDENSGFDLLDDKKTVVITLTDAPVGTAADQQEEVALTIKDIEAVSGAKFEEVTIENIELFDNTIPKALSAAVVGKYAVKVIFSEPIATTAEALVDEFEVDGGDYIIEKVEKLNNNTEANVFLYSALDEGDLSIECSNGIKDYAGYGIAKKTFDLDVVEDEEAPEVVGYKDAKPSGVTLIFNEDIVVTDDDEDNFYHTNSKNPVVKKVVADGKELKLTFIDGTSDNSLPEGSAKIYIEKEVLEDLWENENAKIAYTIEVTLDTTKPTLNKVEQGDDEVTAKLTFSEELDADSATDTDNYTLLDSDGKEIEDAVSGASLGGDDNEVVTLTFDEELGGNYSIVVEDVEDLADNKISKTTMAFEMKDTSAPKFTDFTAKVYNANAKDQMIKVSFGEAMATSGAYSVVDLDKYVVAADGAEVNTGKNLADVDDVTIKAVDGGKAVEIKIPKDELVIAADQDLFIARVADAADNKTEALLSGAINIDGEGAVAFDTVELTNGETVVVTLKDKLTTFKAADFILYVDDSGDDNKYTDDTIVAYSKIKHTVNSDGNSVITFTLKEDFGTIIDSSDDDLDLRLATKASPDSKNIYGEFLAVYDEPVVDKAAPVVKEDGIVLDSATQITITLTEDIDFGYLLGSMNGFSVKGGDAELTKVVVAGDTITLTGTDFTKNTDVFYSDVFGLKDAAGNKLASFSKTDALKVP